MALYRRSWSVVVLSMVIGPWVVGCGGGASEAPASSAPVEPSKPPPAPAPAASEAPLEPTVGNDATPQTADTGGADAKPGPDAQREIRFVQTPEGLRVE